MAKKKKIRAEFRKNRSPRARSADLTRHFDPQRFQEDRFVREERVSGKGELTRRRTIVAEESPAASGGDVVSLAVDLRRCRPGRVLRVHGLYSHVQDADGTIYRCATRRILKTLATEQRHVVTAGDRVLFRPVEKSHPKEGFIERIEPRRGVLSRSVRGRQHLLVTNVDFLAVVASAAEPRLKPNLIDRLLVAAEKGGVQPVICINKIDLVDPAALQPLVGVYSQMGYPVLLLSAVTGFDVERLKRLLIGRSSVVAGQSGVGKSSLLNAVDPSLHLKVQPVSVETEKGKHTTAAAQLIPLADGGYVVDTPGIRQFQLWDTIAEEIEGCYRDLRPYAHLCRFPDCTHTHEAGCAVKNAVADGRLDARRYESYCKLRTGETG
ncbi:MAG: ribosome small subunit-dependent GTPase A [Pirellulales bacterium]|nr:ribosome small subunit-dependent GTPase A [Pirellulales bacterium]